MTDEEIVERAKEAEKRTGFGELVHSPISKGVNSAFGIGFIEGMVEYRNSMQEESVELKEAELDKEIDLVEDKYYGFESLSRADVIEIIKYFFRLGLAQKGE